MTRDCTLNRIRFRKAKKLEKLPIYRKQIGIKQTVIVRKCEALLAFRYFCFCLCSMYAAYRIELAYRYLRMENGS